ncbi:flagellar biosynthetic protein FliR [Corticimicrobacter populi]|uniref:Flagellar biosynthetic protein FliR n=1 Tax=Corticimicrobacter populi TaxID=2175229 RepID=A0A2V1JTQ5_9BURK|nr:flagellar biosynthetic protein FliR [Corticimicrobacter populi]PWF21181.1 flagellar biosynthetic protein FliR [Corticimicrobacter populi]
MFSFTIDQLYGWMAAFLWPFFRLLGLFASAPLFGESTIPKRVKIALAAALTVAVAPALGPMPDIPPASYAGLGIAVQQTLIGIMLGLTMRVVFAAVQTAGEYIGLQMGLSFASFFDPSTGGNTAVLSRMLNLIAMLLFLALDGHLLMLQGLLHSFETLPISDAPLHVAGWGLLNQWGGQVIISGLLMALPLMTALMTINLCMAILNRTAPQMSVFAVGFPISLIAGMIMLTVMIPQTSGFLERLIAAGLETMEGVAAGFAVQGP